MAGIGVVLALDIATNSGAAFDSPIHGVPITRLIKLPRSEHDGPKDNKNKTLSFGPKFSKFRSELVRLIIEVKPALIVYEAPLQILRPGMVDEDGKPKIRTTMDTIRVLLGLAALAEEVACSMDVPCEEARIDKIKRHFTGNSRAKKEDVVARCRQLKWDCGGDHNRADAAALWSMAKSMKDPAWSPISTPLFSALKPKRIT